MQTDFHLLYPPDYDRNKAVPMKDYKFIQALKIDAMVILIKESYRGVADLSLENFFSTDERVLEYRLGVVVHPNANMHFSSGCLIQTAPYPTYPVFLS